MDFFEPVTTPPPDPTAAPMLAPHRPDNVIGVRVSIQLLLARTPEAAVMVQHLIAFSSGFEFQVVAQFRPKGEVWDPMHGLAFLRGKEGDRYGERLRPEPTPPTGSGHFPHRALWPLSANGPSTASL